MIKTLLVGTTLIIGGIYAAGLTGYLPNIAYSEGQRSGTVVKLSRKGYVCKTWEGQMDMGSFKSTGTGLGTTMFEFSVIDPVIIDAVNLKAASGERATLTYSEMLLPAPCQRDTSYLVTKVE